MEVLGTETGKINTVWDCEFDKYYDLEKNKHRSARSLNQINSTWSNELDMGNGDTLRDFMIWATDEYPAQKKILIIWRIKFIHYQKEHILCYVFTDMVQNTHMIIL